MTEISNNELSNLVTLINTTPINADETNATQYTKPPTTPPPTPPKGRKDFFTIGELSGMINRNPDTIRKQLNKASVKPSKAGKYSLTKVKEIFEDAAKRDLRNIDPANSKQRKTQLECEILQAKLDQIKGNQISLDDHTNILLQSHQMIKQQIINLPKEVAQLTSDIEANKAVKKLVENLCNTIANNFKTVFETDNEPLTKDVKPI